MGYYHGGCDPPVVSTRLPALTVDEYLDMLADDAAFMRELHGGHARWWIGHNSQKCIVCQMVTTPIDTRQTKKVVLTLAAKVEKIDEHWMK